MTEAAVKIPTGGEEVSTERIYASVDEIVASGASEVEYRIIQGFEGKDGPKIRIGSVTAGDMIEFSEANENDRDAKRDAGLRLIAKSLVGPAPDNIRYADGPAIARHMAKFRTMRHKETERVVKEILDLNGMEVKKDAAAKKD
jgi:hypothetical protein